MLSFPVRRRTSARTLRHALTFAVVALLIFQQLVLVSPPAAQAASADIVISQVYGGGGNSGATLKNDFIELYNRGAAPVNVTGWSVQYASSAGNSWQKTDISGTILPGKYYLIQEAAGTGGTQNLPTPNATGTIPMSGTAGKVALVTNQTLLTCGSTTSPCLPNPNIRDFVGFGGATNFEGSGPTAVLSNTTAALRLGGGATDTDNNAADFAVGAPNPRRDDTAPTVAGTSPASDATDVSQSANITVTFNEPVTVNGNWFTISCQDSDLHTAAVSGGPTTFTLNPDSDFLTNEQCTLTVLAGQVLDQDISDPPDNMVGNYSASFSTVSVDLCTIPFTHIYTVQGSESASQFANGTSVTVRGVVTGDFQGGANLSGFFIQDQLGDSDATTSDGVFVFAPGSADVSAGDDVVVRGKVQEFNTLTEISNVTTVTKCGTGSIAPTVVDLPETTEGELERYEGMLVSIPETLTVNQNFFQGRYGQVSLSSDGRLFTPTNSHPPTSPAAIAEADSNARRRLVLDDGSSTQNPAVIPYIGQDNTLRAGDIVAGLTGLIDFGQVSSDTSIRDYRLHPTSAPAFTRANPRTAAPEPVGGNIKVASFNVLNYFNGNGTGGGFPTSRGASTLTEFNRQRAKIIAALTAIDADVAGLIEMENDGSGPTSATQDLVNGLNAATAPDTYGLVVGPDPGTDEIQTVFIYKKAAVTPVGAPVNDTDPVHNRNPLAQTFKSNQNGEKFTVIVNHFKSKSSCPASPSDPNADQGDGQGCWNLQRVQQAEALLTFIGSVKAASGDDDVLVIGDLNSYGKEDPITTLVEGGLVDQIALHIAHPYSYVFDHTAGYLDHALASASLSGQVSGVTEWHINADEPSVIDYNTEFKPQDLYTPTPYRSSDHDPVIVGLDLNAPPAVGQITAVPNPALLNGAVNFSANFTDADAGDTHTATWEWGDGTSSAGTISGGTVTGSHTYSAVGTYTVTLTVTDSHDNAGTSTVQVVVTYGVVPLYDQAKAHKSGSTIPVKLQLTDAAGNNLSGPSLVVHVTGITPAPSGTDFDSGNANPGDNFRFDPSLGGYVFNLSTKGLAPGEYTLSFTVTGDPVTHTLKFVVR